MDDVLLKIERADKHIKELHTALRAFIDSRPYTVRTKTDPQTRRLIYYIAKAEPVPVELALITSDIFQNLRTALDYLVCALVRANGASDRQSAFPILDAGPISGNAKAQFEQKTEGMRDEAKDIIRGIKPYKGGDDLLWSLHKLNNRDKHRLLFTVGTALRSLDLGSYMIGKVRKRWGPSVPDLSLWVTPSDRLFPLKLGDEVFSDVPDAEPSEDLKFVFDVALDEPGIVTGEPLIAVVRARQQRVMRVVEMFAGMY